MCFIFVPLFFLFFFSLPDYGERMLCGRHKVRSIKSLDKKHKRELEIHNDKHGGNTIENTSPNTLIISSFSFRLCVCCYHLMVNKDVYLQIHLRYLTLEVIGRKYSFKRIHSCSLSHKAAKNPLIKEVSRKYNIYIKIH